MKIIRNHRRALYKTVSEAVLNFNIKLHILLKFCYTELWLALKQSIGPNIHCNVYSSLLT